jgi:hypothetical protein
VKGFGVFAPGDVDAPLTAMLTGALTVPTCVVYALQSVTFDCFRPAGGRREGEFSSTERDR